MSNMMMMGSAPPNTTFEFNAQNLNFVFYDQQQPFFGEWRVYIFLLGAFVFLYALSFE